MRLLFGVWKYLLCLQRPLLLHHGERESQKALLERFLRKGVYTARVCAWLLWLLLVAQVVLPLCEMSGSMHIRVGKTQLRVRRVQVPLGSSECASELRRLWLWGLL